MRPHPNHLYGPDIFQNLVYKAVLNIDAPGISPGKIPHQLFKGWRALKGILRKYLS